MDALSGAPLNTSSAESSACIVAMVESVGVVRGQRWKFGMKHKWHLYMLISQGAGFLSLTSKAYRISAEPWYIVIKKDPLWSNNSA